MTLINCDLGECLASDPDKIIMPLIHMANIACGGHVGNEKSITKTILMAKDNGVCVGAHPSYLDQENFGRISQQHSNAELFQIIYQQVKSFDDLCEQHNISMEYIKPHGALYHDMMHKQAVLEVLCQVIEELNLPLSLVVQAGKNTTIFERFSEDYNIRFLYEMFADRGYQALQIIPRGEQGAMLEDAQQVVAQYQYFSEQQTITIDTICFHSDNPASVEALKMLKYI
ncbi:MAG: hypothetical protein COB23_01795 [Methylophaga sp.]|nr:MAG: hypothetical protein COB23_01795 [Methylophaga sp.]